MSFGAFHLVLAVSLFVSADVDARQDPATVECADWESCRQQVEQALESGTFERAHDLAWRAVQRGPKDDGALMFLLARAQCLSGRPHDALVMVRRLAERGVPTDALTHPDLARTRALPAWTEVAVVVARAGADAERREPAPESREETERREAGTDRPEETTERRDASPERLGLSPGDIPAAEETPGLKPLRSDNARSNPGSVPGTVPGNASDAAPAVEEALRFSSDPFVTAGLAYDAVSHRLVLGDRHGRKLRVVSEGQNYAVDLVRAASAGFLDVRALGIDTRRGDLWVASADENGATGTLHQLQLVSGRPLRELPFGDDLLPVSPLDLTVTPAGVVLALDQSGRLMRVRPGGKAVESVMQLKARQVTSVATGSTEGVAYVAHLAGVLRVDLTSRSATEVAAPADVSLSGLERIRAFRGGLVGLQTGPDGTRRIVRLQLNATGRAVRAVTALDPPIEAAEGPAAFAVSGDEVLLVTAGSGPAPVDFIADTTAGPPAELVVRRFRFR